MPAEKLILTAALAGAQMALGASRRIEGPRLQDTQFTGGDPGAPRPRFWGTYMGQKTAIFGEELKGVEREAKTKGGKTNNTTYFATWAVEIACHPVDAVTRIKFDTHLVYDATGAGPLTPFEIGYSQVSGKSGDTEFISVDLADHLRFYLGGEDQEPDPRMEATIDALHGEGSSPAYRGTAIAVFVDVPVEKFGNRVPQVTIEAVRDAEPSYPYETFETQAPQPNRLWNFTFSPDGSRFMWAIGNEYEIWDTAARARMIGGTLPISVNSGSKLGLYDDGTWLAVDGGNDHVLQFSADGLSYATIFTFGGISKQQQEVRVLKDGGGNEHWATIPWSFYTTFFFDGAEYTMEDLTGVAWQPLDWFVDGFGDIWAVGRVVAASVTTCHFKRMVDVSGRGGVGYFTATGLAATGTGPGDVAAVHYADGTLDQFVIHWEHNDLYAIEIGTGAVLEHVSAPGLDVYNTDKQFANCPPGRSTIWLNEVEYSLADLSVVRTLDLTDWKNENADGIIYDPVNHALICAPQFDQVITLRYLDRVAGASTTLQTVVEDVCDLAGIPAAEIDASALTQPIRGYGVTTGSGKDWLEPLLQLYDVDPRPHGFGLQFVPRGGAAGSTIELDQFVRPEDAGSPYYRTRAPGPRDLPDKVVLKFADADADHQPNSALSGPIGGGAAGEMVLDLANLVLTPSEARQLAARYHRRLQFEEGGVDLDLPRAQIALEPADRLLLALGGSTRDARLHTMLWGADGRVVTEWKPDDPSLAFLDGAEGAPLDGHRPDEVLLPGIVKGFVLDIPLLRDVDSQTSPLVYAAAAPYGGGDFPGAAIWRLVSGEYSDQLASISAANAASWGYTTDALGAPASVWLWDRANSVNVVLQNGALTGTTPSAIDANPVTNLALIGGELVNFAAATLEGDGSYTLSGLRRGRRGTEWAAVDHAAGDIFVLLSTAAAKAMSLSDVGTNQTFKAAANGRSVSGAFPIALAPLTGASLKPRAPANLRWKRDPASGDWTATWIRRTRVGGAWTGGTPIPLSEASEEYELDIYDGPAVVRAITGLSTPTYTYSAADQTTDFGAPLAAAPDALAYQISDAVGRGFAAAA